MVDNIDLTRRAIGKVQTGRISLTGMCNRYGYRPPLTDLVDEFSQIRTVDGSPARL